MEKGAHGNLYLECMTWMAKGRTRREESIKGERVISSVQGCREVKENEDSEKVLTFGN